MLGIPIHQRFTWLLEINKEVEINDFYKGIKERIYSKVSD